MIFYMIDAHTLSRHLALGLLPENVLVRKHNFTPPAQESWCVMLSALHN